MTATMTWLGLDVHARSTHAAAIDRESGALSRARFGAGARGRGRERRLSAGWIRLAPAR
jgi:hypothetical protein